MWICHTTIPSKASQQREKSSDVRGLNDMLLRRHAGSAKSSALAENRLESGSRHACASHNGTPERISRSIFRKVDVRVSPENATTQRLYDVTPTRARTDSIGSRVAAQKSQDGPNRSTFICSPRAQACQ